LIVLDLDRVFSRGRVASVGVEAEVRCGEAGIGLVTVLLRAPNLEFYRLEETSGRIRTPAQLPNDVDYVKAGVSTAVEALEAIAGETVPLHQPTKLRPRVAGPQVLALVAVLAALEDKTRRAVARDAGREVVDHSAHGVGALGDRTRTLEHFQALNATYGGRLRE
jgi:hypothetical protein